MWCSAAGRLALVLGTLLALTCAAGRDEDRGAPSGPLRRGASLLQQQSSSPRSDLASKALLRRAMQRLREGGLTQASDRARVEEHQQAAAQETRFRATAGSSAEGIGALTSAVMGTAFTTWTDVEMCQGCRALMQVVVRSTSKDAAVRDVMFAIHSACNDQPEVFMEACTHATHYDANLGVLRQETDDVEKLCKLGGMCAR